MSNSNYYQNPEFISKKNKSIGFDINSEEYKLMKVNTLMRLSNGFIKESIIEEKTMTGICAIYYIPEDQKSLSIKMMGNVMDVDITKYNNSYKKYKMVNMFIPFNKKEISDSEIEQAAKLFCFENNPFAIAILKESTSKIVIAEENIDIEIPNVICHYIEYSDATFNMFSFCNVSASQIIDVYKKQYDENKINAYADIDEMSTEAISFYISNVASTKSGKDNNHIPFPVGLHCAINKRLNNLEKKAQVQITLDSTFPPFDLNIVNTVTEDEYLFKHMDLMKEKCLKIHGDSNLNIKDSNSQDNNYNGFYLYENADKKIVNNISEDLNNLLTDFLKNL